MALRSFVIVALKSLKIDWIGPLTEVGPAAAIADETLPEVRPRIEVADFEIERIREEFRRNPGGAGGGRSPEQRVAGEGEMEFVNRTDFRKCTDQTAATFAVEMFDAIV